MSFHVAARSENFTSGGLWHGENRSLNIEYFILILFNIMINSFCTFIECPSFFPLVTFNKINGMGPVTTSYPTLTYSDDTARTD